MYTLDAVSHNPKYTGSCHQGKRLPLKVGMSEIGLQEIITTLMVESWVLLYVGIWSCLDYGGGGV